MNGLEDLVARACDAVRVTASVDDLVERSITRGHRALRRRRVAQGVGGTAVTGALVFGMFAAVPGPRRVRTMVGAAESPSPSAATVVGADGITFPYVPDGFALAKPVAVQTYAGDDCRRDSMFVFTPGGGPVSDDGAHIGVLVWRGAVVAHPELFHLGQAETLRDELTHAVFGVAYNVRIPGGFINASTTGTAVTAAQLQQLVDGIRVGDPDPGTTPTVLGSDGEARTGCS